MKSKLTTLLILLSSTSFPLISCSDDETGMGELNISDYQASLIVSTTVETNGDPSDWEFQISPPVESDQISEYRIFYEKSSSQVDTSTDGLELLKGLNSSRYTSINQNASASNFRLSNTQLSILGEPIELNENYTVYNLSIGTDNNDDEILAVTTIDVPILEGEGKAETSTLVTSFNGNGSITIDDDGNIYVNEFGAGSGDAGLGTSAFKISPSGEVEEFVSNLSGPVGNALDEEGNYYLNNGNEGSEGDFMQIKPNGSQVVIATITGYPTDILTGTDGNFYIANWTRPVISKVTPTGQVTDFASDSRLAGCTGIVYDDNGNILVGNFSTGRIMSIDTEGTVIEIGTVPTVVQGFVIGYIEYFEGHVYATGYGSNKIYKVSLDGNVQEFAGNGARASTDGELDKASFMTPNGIAIDKTRRILYVSQNALGNPTSLRAIPLD